MARKREKKKRGNLIKHYLQEVKSTSFGAIGPQIKKILRGQPGIYALYKRDKLYYVGLASDLYWRLKNHTWNRHKNKWDKFTAFIIAKGRYLKDIETMLHTISEPPANVWKGKFKHHYEYDKKIRSMVKDAFDVINKIKLN